MLGKKVVAIGLSGGVDSSVAAALLLEAGYEVIGVFMHFWREPVCGRVRDNVCCSAEAQADSRRVAAKLVIPFYTMNMDAPFKEMIVDYFIDEYQQGRTPNPCVMCNRYIKFGEFIKKAKLLGADFVATGHYAKLGVTSNQPPVTSKLLKAKDEHKDQTYFLHQLKQSQLKKIIFPVGNYTKDEVRALAVKYGLPTATKKESQEICFIPDNDLRNFLERYVKMEKGKIRNWETQEVLGEHEGLPLYTIGQRKRIGLSGGPWFVRSKDSKTNVLCVTTNEADLLSDFLVVRGVNWLSGNEPDLSKLVDCRVRYGGVPVKARITKNTKNSYKVDFSKPVRAVAPGQFAVFYRGNECLGGGEIV